MKFISQPRKLKQFHVLTPEEFHWVTDIPSSLSAGNYFIAISWHFVALKHQTRVPVSILTYNTYLN